MVACSDSNLAPPACEQQPEIQRLHLNQIPSRAACITRLDDQLLVIALKGEDGYQLPATKLINGEQPHCTAHRSLWQQTQLNALVTQYLGQLDQQIAVFNCDISHSFDVAFSDFPIPHNQANIENITMLNPFEISDKQWHNRDEFVRILDLFNLAK